MSKPLLIIISGLPCTGKTTLGRKIAKDLKTAENQENDNFLS